MCCDATKLLFYSLSECSTKCALITRTTEYTFYNAWMQETEMLKYDEKASKSELYARIKLAPMNAIQRTIAVNALRDADALTDAIMWVVNGVRRLVTRAGNGANPADARPLRRGGAGVAGRPKVRQRGARVRRSRGNTLRARAAFSRASSLRVARPAVFRFRARVWDRRARLRCQNSPRGLQPRSIRYL